MALQCLDARIPIRFNNRLRLIQSGSSVLKFFLVKLPVGANMRADALVCRGACANIPPYDREKRWASRTRFVSCCRSASPYISVNLSFSCGVESYPYS